MNQLTIFFMIIGISTSSIFAQDLHFEIGQETGNMKIDNQKQLQKDFMINEYRGQIVPDIYSYMGAIKENRSSSPYLKLNTGYSIQSVRLFLEAEYGKRLSQSNADALVQTSFSNSQVSNSQYLQYDFKAQERIDQKIGVGLGYKINDTFSGKIDIGNREYNNSFHLGRVGISQGHILGLPYQYLITRHTDASEGDTEFKTDVRGKYYGIGLFMKPMDRIKIGLEWSNTPEMEGTQSQNVAYSQFGTFSGAFGFTGISENYLSSAKISANKTGITLEYNFTDWLHFVLGVENERRTAAYPGYFKLYSYSLNLSSKYLSINIATENPEMLTDLITYNSKEKISESKYNLGLAFEFDWSK